MENMKDTSEMTISEIRNLNNKQLLGAFQLYVQKVSVESDLIKATEYLWFKNDVLEIILERLNDKDQQPKSLLEQCFELERNLLLSLDSIDDHRQLDKIIQELSDVTEKLKEKRSKLFQEYVTEEFMDALKVTDW